MKSLVSFKGRNPDPSSKASLNLDEMAQKISLIKLDLDKNSQKTPQKFSLLSN